MTTRADVIREAESWLGRPYKHAGRNEFGIDCAGLVIKVAHGTGISFYDTVNYSRRPNPKEFKREMKNHLDVIQLRVARPADIIMFRGDRIPCHLGILDFNGNVIHAYAVARKVVRDPYVGQFKDLAAMAFRYRGLED